MIAILRKVFLGMCFLLKTELTWLVEKNVFHLELLEGKPEKNERQIILFVCVFKKKKKKTIGIELHIWGMKQSP